jgi:hypothetical protein
MLSLDTLETCPNDMNLKHELLDKLVRLVRPTSISKRPEILIFYHWILST